MSKISSPIMYKALSWGLFVMLFAGFSIIPTMAHEDGEFEQKKESIGQYYDEKYMELDKEYLQYESDMIQKIEQNDFSDSEIDAMYKEFFAFYEEARAEIDSSMISEFEELDKMFQEELERSGYEYDSQVREYEDHGDYDYSNPYESDPEWQSVEPLAQRIVDIIPMDKIQRLWESPQHDALVEIIVAETDLTVEQAKKVIAFFERVEKEDYDQHEEYDYYEKDYPDYDYVEDQPHYDDSEVLRLKQRIADLEEENNTLRNTISDLEEKLEKANTIVLEQIKIIQEGY